MRIPSLNLPNVHDFRLLVVTGIPAKLDHVNLETYHCPSRVTRLLGYIIPNWSVTP